MKNFTLAVIVILFSLKLQSQSTLILQPDSTCGKDAFIWIADAPGFNNENTNYGTHPSMLIHSWTTQGLRDDTRSLFQFDLSGIPLNSTIQSAYLTLYNDPTSGSFGGQHQNLTGTNESFIRRITSSWNEYEVNWNTMPSVSLLNTVLVPASVSPNQDFLNIDVTVLVNDMIANPASSFGFMMVLQNEMPYKALVFASSDNANPNKHPMLIINYTPPTTAIVCYHFRIDAGCGKDLFIWRADAPGFNNSNTNYGASHTLLTHSWTTQGLADNGRTLLDFNPDEIPSNAIIISADLSLYNDLLSSSFSGQHQNLTGFNNSIIQRVTSLWSEYAVTWNTLPTVTAQNQVSVPASVSPNQDFVNINITQLFQDLISNPGSSHGLMMTLFDETPYKALVFASSKNSVASRHPVLDVCYQMPVGISAVDHARQTISILPNVTNGFIQIKFTSADNYDIGIYDVWEKLVMQENVNGELMNMDLSFLGKGMYFVHVKSDRIILTEKIILN